MKEKNNIRILPFCLLLIFSITACEKNISNTSPEMIQTNSSEMEERNDFNVSDTAIVDTSGYFYKPDKYKLVGGECGGNRFIPGCMNDLEIRAQSWEDENGEGIGIIIQCVVVGPSINRIIEPEDKTHGGYGYNHVLTPVRIEKVFYKGTGIILSEGDVVLLREPYFYVEENAKPYCDDFEIGSVYAQEYTPMQEGFHYLVYSIVMDEELYNYEGKAVPGTMGLQEAVYCLTDEVTAKQVVNYENTTYWDIWKEVISKYGNVE